MDLLSKEDVDPSKVYLSHMCFTSSDVEYHRSILDEYNVTLSYDAFGIESYLDSLWPGASGVSDQERVKGLVELINSGYEKRIVVGQDVCKKMLLKKYGGYGYAHVLEHIVPWLRQLGVTNKQINRMLVDNMKRIFS